MEIANAVIIFKNLFAKCKKILFFMRIYNTLLNVIYGMKKCV